MTGRNFLHEHINGPLCSLNTGGRSHICKGCHGSMFKTSVVIHKSAPFSQKQQFKYKMCLDLKNYKHKSS